MCTYCGAKCENCGFKENCPGCKETCGKPFGGDCVAAEYIKQGGIESFNSFKKQLIDEINALNIEGIPKATELFELAGSYVNLAYPMPNGYEIQLIDDKKVYLGCQLCSEFDEGDGERCFGIIADTTFIIVAEYGANGTNPELVMYKRR